MEAVRGTAGEAEDLLSQQQREACSTDEGNTRQGGALCERREAAAVAVQAGVRGWLARRSVARQRREELEFLGMLAPSDCGRSAALQQRVAAIAKQRKARQASRQRELDDALLSIKAAVRQQEGFAMKDQIRDKVGWWALWGLNASRWAWAPGDGQLGGWRQGRCSKACHRFAGMLAPAACIFPNKTCRGPAAVPCPLQLNDWFLKSRDPATGEYADLPEAAKGGSRDLVLPPPPEPTPEEAAAAAKAAQAGAASAGRGSSGRGAKQAAAPKVTQEFLQGLKEAVQLFMDVWQQYEPSDPTLALREPRRTLAAAAAWRCCLLPELPFAWRLIVAGAATALLQCHQSCGACRSPGGAAGRRAMMQTW